MAKPAQFSAAKRFRVTAFQLIPVLVLLAGVVFGVMNFNTIRQLIIGATGEPANIVIDTSAVIGTMPRPWRNLAQGGEAAAWRLQPVANQVRALNPEYIRLDHIYDFYNIVNRDGGTLTYNWTEFDLMIRDILAVGAKPYISLSYTPPVIAPDGDITGVPTNWGEYQQIIYRTIVHVSKEMGVENAIYEVYNEPDLFGGWKVYGSKNYLALYRTAANAAKQAEQAGTKPFQFGGPAITALYENWVDSLLQLATEENLRLDFFSWHRYDNDFDVYTKDYERIEAWTARYPRFANLEFHITEWGHDSKNHAGYDGRLGAAHTAAVATGMVGRVTRGFVFEIQDGKDPAGQQYWGRWGLLTHGDFGSVAKPRYNALRLIDRIGDQRLQMLGRGSWVKGMAAKKDTSITTVLANYDPLGSHGETVPVTYTNLTDRSFLLEQTFLDGTRRTQQVATTEAQLKVLVPMLANSVVFMELKPSAPTQ